MSYTEKDEIVFVDTEVDPHSKKVEDIGAIRTAVPVSSVIGRQFHSENTGKFEAFIENAFFLCGHNIVKFDLKYIFSSVEKAGIRSVIDTLYLSPLLFPQHPYHKLVKDDKLRSDELNNPLNDARKTMELFMDEVSTFENLNINLKKIYYTLLGMVPNFRGFFTYLKFRERTNNLEALVHAYFKGKICTNVAISELAQRYPVELVYCLSVISIGDKNSIIPYWVQKTYPKVQDVYRLLCGIPCHEGCVYCMKFYNIQEQLKKKFGYDDFRKYNGQPLQEKAVDAAIHGKSLLAVFPTGGGKSITFQLPALIEAETTHGLTVVISPLQSLMKDQVDNLSQKGITDAVTINGLLNTLDRAEALNRVESGIASILYISPELLRSKTIERLLMGRHIARFVIDEAHCFSSWGQDFRVDYLYIGDFIAKLQASKCITIPVSCFTATAKQKVISDIREYFKKKLNLELELFTTSAARMNLRYEVLYRENNEKKYDTLRGLIEQKSCPTIVYVSRTKRAEEIAQKLYRDGFNAKPFHGKMNSEEKITSQEEFIRGEVQIIVATSAFGMGVDKKDVKLVVHYDISTSLENYMQEAGRAGRDENIQAECYVLFNENDLDKHFIFLNQNKLSISEIQQVWKGIKDLTKNRDRICCSALEIARQAGWDESVDNIETKVRTAISALEVAGYLKRGQNCPRVYADSIQVRNMQEAADCINHSNKFDATQKENAKRIIEKLISTRSRAAADTTEAECRVDYIADHLGITKQNVIEAVNIMREVGILANEREMSVYVDIGMLRSRRKNTALSSFSALERFLLEKLQNGGVWINYKLVNEEATNNNIKSSTVSNLRRLLYFWVIKGYIKKPEGEISNTVQVIPEEDVDKLKKRYQKRMAISHFIEQFFLERAKEKLNQQNISDKEKNNIIVNFSIQELQRSYDNEPKLIQEEKVSLHEVEESLLYLSKINAFRLEGGFLVLYNAMDITRLERDNKKRYKLEDYKQLSDFYISKTQQIHIVGEYANMMVSDYQAALTFVNDYFQMEYKLFLTKYFKGARLSEIDRNITPMKYQQLFNNLSQQQTDIINDDTSKVIVVAAGPGSGKTRILVHKLASLMLLEDVKHEQLLMLTFSRAAAMEFKKRLVELIGNAAYFIEIKTFHSYCFDLLGKIGDIKKSETVVHDATQMILNGDVELDRITKNVLVLDEAQDMNQDEFGLVRALMEHNEEMRVIAVGDDDQNIYEFRGSSSQYMQSFMYNPDAHKYELIENFRSSYRVVAVANEFAKKIHNRIKNSPICPIKQETGEVFITKVQSHLEMSVANGVEMTWKKGSGNVGAVLTSTNIQAYIVSELLNKRGFKVKLIQSNDGFALYNLFEMRYFLGQIKSDAPIVEEHVWTSAIEKLKNKYSRSVNLKPCIRLLEEFAKVNPRKYYTDFEEFLREVHFEDFSNGSEDTIYVSTIHKAKGKEFDWVYMLLSDDGEFNDELARRIYVGMTRAKSNLYIYHNTNYFYGFENVFQAMGVQFCNDKTYYQEPHEIVLALTHRDVWLSYPAEDIHEEILDTLQGGDELYIAEGDTFDRGRIRFSVNYDGKLRRVACTSKKFYEKINKYKLKGYIPYQAKVLFVVKWMDKENECERSIVLPLLKLKKMI